MYGAPSGSNKKTFQSTTNVGSSKDYKVFEIIQIGPRIEKTEPSKRYKGQITRRCVCVLIHSCFPLSSLIPDFHYCGGHFPVHWVSLGVVIGFLSVISVLFDAWRINVKLLVLMG